MYSKRRKNFDKRKRKKILKPRYKVTFISLDDPRVHKEIEKKIYEEYLRRLHSNGGDDNG